MVKWAFGETLGAVESQEGHRDRRQLPEEGEVVGAAGAPLPGGRETRARQQGPGRVDDLRVVLQRGLPGDELDPAAAAVGGGDAGHHLLDHLPQRQAVLPAVGPQGEARPGTRRDDVLRRTTLERPHGQHRRMQWVDPPGHLGVQGDHHLGERQDGIATMVRIGAV
jgi:hypothetical protein